MALWWIGNAVVALVVIPLVAVLAVRVIRTAAEISRYGDDIAAHGTGLARNLEHTSALDTTSQLVGTVGEHGSRYLAALRRAV